MEMKKGKQIGKKKKINLTQRYNLYGWTDEPAAWTDEEMNAGFKVIGWSGLQVGYCGYVEAEDEAQQVSGVSLLSSRSVFLFSVHQL